MEFTRAGKLLLASAILGFAFFVGWYQCPYAGGADSSGYLNSARLMLNGKLSAPLRIPEQLPPGTLRNEQFIPLGFWIAGSGASLRLVPTYPVGLPLCYVAAAYLVGLDHAATLVALVAALAFPFLIYLVAREFGVRPGWGAGVAVAGALSPLTLFLVLQPLSDHLAATLGVGLILCAMRASRHLGWAALAGVTLALAVLVRPTCTLLFLPVAVALPLRWRSWLAFGLAGLPGAVFLGIYNATLYGSPATSGYGSVGSLFSVRYVLPTLVHFALWVPVVATPLVCAAFALPWLKIPRRQKAILIAWAAPLFLFYSAYMFTHETWWFLRFILPALPPLGIAAALALQQVRIGGWLVTIRRESAGEPAKTTRPMHTFRLAVPPALVLIFTVAWLVAWGRYFSVSQVEAGERTYPLTARWVAKEIPQNAVIAAMQVSGALLYYTDRPFVRYDMFTPESYARFNASLARQHAPLFAVLFPFEEDDALQRRMPGKWETVARIRTATVWRRVALADEPAPPAPVPAAR